ncbi:MAG: ABC transporter substrate-binding protein, partial [Actinomycetota bacterium]
MNPRKDFSPWIAAGFVMVLSLVATFTLSKPVGTTNVAGGLPAGFPTSFAGDAVPGVNPTTDAGLSGGGGGVGSSGPGSAAVDSRYDCAKGQNAGATDWGVTAHAINFAATVVKTGIAKDFLFDAQYGIEAVRQKINRAGGVCGRTINVEYKNDEWNPTKGQQIIESWIGSHSYFGLAVNPSSEGLRGPIDSGLISSNKFPVIGADGMLIDQYKDPWVWPVATSTSSVMHIMANNAITARGAHTFGIVWDGHYRFGVEGHAAFVAEVKRLGGVVNSDQQVDGTQGTFSTAARQFVDGCGGTSFSKCDFVAMLLEPAAADSWVTKDGGLGDGRQRPRVGIGAPQPLFLNSFA